MYFKPDYFEEEMEIRNEYLVGEITKNVSPYYVHDGDEKCIIDGKNKKGAEKNYLRLYPNAIKEKLIINTVEEEFE
jgi:hypothetical protein